MGIYNKFTGIFQRFFSDKWNIGYVSQTPEEFISRKGLAADISWLSEDSADYSADPFIMTAGNQHYIYYEYLDHWDGLGRIYQIVNFDFRTRKRVTGLPRNVHLSYPYTFAEGDDHYCIPETARANEIALYKIDKDDPARFIKLKVLVGGDAYVDSSLVRYNGKYWLITSRRGTSDLYIFHADSLQGEFQPHPLNPVSQAGKSFRGGGSMFIVDGVLYRPVQNCAVRYGGSLVIDKITTLNEREYQSEPYFEVFPSEPYPNGLHTISFGDNLIVVDGRRRRLSPLMPLKRVLRRFR